MSLRRFMTLCQISLMVFLPATAVRAADLVNHNLKFRVPVQGGNSIAVVAAESVGDQLAIVVNSGGSSLVVLTSREGKALHTAALGAEVMTAFPSGDTLIMEFKDKRRGAILHADGRVENITFHASGDLIRGAGRKVFEVANGRARLLGAVGQSEGYTFPAHFQLVDGTRIPLEVHGTWIQIDRAEGAIVSNSGETFRLSSKNLDGARARVAANYQAGVARNPLPRQGTPLLVNDVTETARGFLASCAGVRLSEGALLIEFDKQGRIIRESRPLLPKLDSGRHMVPSEIVTVGFDLFIVDPSGEVARYDFRY